MNRRPILYAIASAFSGLFSKAYASQLRGYPPGTRLDPGFVPAPIVNGSNYKVLTDELLRRTVSAAFDRLMPEDELGPSATQAGCVDFLDAQLAGSFGQGLSLYRDGPEPANADTMMQVPQFIATPHERYMTGLAALEKFAKANHGASFADLAPAQQDDILYGMEAGSVTLAEDVNTKAFFELLLQNVREGYFADPIYGGNKDMAGWKMIGFPGARYDYRRYTDKVGQKLDLQPVSLIPRN